MRTRQHGTRTGSSRLGILFAAALPFLSASPLAAQDEPIEQWVSGSTGISSSVTTVAGSESQIRGEPVGSCALFEDQDFVGTALRFGTPDGGDEWVELRFKTPVHPTAVEVHESLNPGAVTRILVRDLEGRLHEVWAGTDPNDTCPAVLRADFAPLPVAAAIVRVELNTALVPGFNQIDAVKLVGNPVSGLDPVFALLEHVGGEAPTRDFDSKAAADLDNDGWPDMLARDAEPGSTVGYRYILHNEGDGTFHYRGPLWEIPEHIETSGGILAGDYDNDGDLDLFYAIGDINRGIPLRNMLLRNDRGTFVDVTAQAGLLAEGLSGTALWLDYDRDGFLDLYVGNWTFPVEDETPERLAVRAAQQNRLYRNNGDGTFEDATVAAGLDIQWHDPASPMTGGTVQGFLAGDFNDDGWVDLYVVVPLSANQLLFNQEGRFRQADSKDIRLAADSFGAAAGDFDNDLDLDLFQAAVFGFSSFSATERLPERSTLFMNLGDGQFTDVTEGVGLGVFNAANVFFAYFFDYDNDGDLDLFPGGGIASYFENTGAFSFIERPFVAAITGIATLADFDGNGFVDLTLVEKIWLNQSSGNHYLAIDPVGTQSNRDGIGVRAIATTGQRRQMRELYPFEGWDQSELSLHFGLGQSTVVDQLEIRWPSGQVDFIDNIPADQRIRVIEGRSQWYPAPRTVWQTPPPAELAFGESARFRAVVRPALFEPTATITQITADLSGLGGPGEVPLEDLGDGTYAFDADFTVGGDAVMRDVEVFILQETSLGEHWINLSRNITVNDDPFTAVLEAYDSTTPESFALNQNYPNPFNSGTAIPFALPKGSEIELAVFNLAGQKVATLVRGYREAGQYKITWDGRDDAGNALATGMYLYRLRSKAGSLEKKKLLLLR